MEQIKVYRSDQNSEEKPAKCIINEDKGVVMSNDGQIRLVVLTCRAFNEMGVQCNFLCYYYIKQADGWLKTSHVNSYRDMDDFFNTLKQTEEFSEAVDEYMNSKTGSL